MRNNKYTFDRTVWSAGLCGWQDCVVGRTVWLAGLCGWPDCVVGRTVWSAGLCGRQDCVVGKLYHFVESVLTLQDQMEKLF